MGDVIPLRPTPPRPKTAAERAVWRVWAPVEGSTAFSFDRWRAAEVARLAASRKAPGVDWVSPFACHLDYVARRLDPRPTDHEILRQIRRLVGLVVPITPAVVELIEEGRGRYRPRAYDLAVALDVSPAEKIKLGLRTVRDITETSDIMRARRNARRRARDAEKRRAAGKEVQAVRRTRARMARRLSELAGISDPTARKWLKAAESDGSLVVASVTDFEFERHVLGVLNRMQGRTNLKIVTPAAERKRRSRDQMKAKAGALKAPSDADALPMPPDLPTIATLAADALTLPPEDVTFDADRQVISVAFRTVRPVPPSFDPAPSIGEILRRGGWPILATTFDGEVIEIAIGEAA